MIAIVFIPSTLTGVLMVTAVMLILWTTTGLLQSGWPTISTGSSSFLGLRPPQAPTAPMPHSAESFSWDVPPVDSPVSPWVVPALEAMLPGEDLEDVSKWSASGAWTSVLQALISSSSLKGVKSEDSLTSTLHAATRGANSRSPELAILSLKVFPPHPLGPWA